MQFGRLARPFALPVLAVLMIPVSPADSRAQGHDNHAGSVTAEQPKPTREQNALVQAVRDATAQFKNVSSVEGPGHGYELMFGCVSGGDFGAMGLHYVNLGLVDGNIVPGEPEAILFEPIANGRIRITGVDYLVPAAAWEQAHPGEGPPKLFGQLFHLFESPNRFGLDTFYTLHVWAYKNNPNGTFVNWNPDVSCDAFTPPLASVGPDGNVVPIGIDRIFAAGLP